MSALMSINEAAMLGHKRFRLDNWANDYDHFEIDIIDGKPGPWIKLWSPINVTVCDQDNPQMMFIHTIGDLDEKCWRNYVGPHGVPEKASLTPCPNKLHCDGLRSSGFMDLYFCLCAIKRHNPDWTAPTEPNPKTAGMVLPKDDHEMQSWANK